MMNQITFEQLTITHRLGISGTGSDTFALARRAINEPHIETALELGCGSGLISLYLARHGCAVTAVDINPQAVALTQENAMANDCQIKAHYSDLFSNVEGQFDLIIFNPPLGNTRHSSLIKPVERIKSLIGKRECIIRFVYWMTRPGRVRMIRDFCRQVSAYLKKDGRVLLFVHRSEVCFFESETMRCEVLEEMPNIHMCLVRVYWPPLIKRHLRECVVPGCR